jgi:hypothetical protein
MKRHISDETIKVDYEISTRSRSEDFVKLIAGGHTFTSESGVG